MVTPEQRYTQCKEIIGDAIKNYPWEFFVESAKGYNTIPEDVSVINLEKIIQECALMHKIPAEQVRLALYSNVFSQMVLYRIRHKSQNQKVMKASMLVTPEQLYAQYKEILGDAIKNYPWEFFVEAARGIDTIPQNVSIVDLEKIIQEFAATQKIPAEYVRLDLYRNVSDQMVLFKIQQKTKK